MKSPLTESLIESLAIELLEQSGYEYLHAPDFAPDSATPERESLEQVLLIGRLEKAVKRINPSIPENVRAEAIKEIQRIASPGLLTNNEIFHRYLTEGIPVLKGCTTKFPLCYTKHNTFIISTFLFELMSYGQWNLCFYSFSIDMYVLRTILIFRKNLIFTQVTLVA